MNALNTNNILQNKTEQKKNYPVKDFLIAKSWLVEFNEKQAAGKELYKAEETKRRIIYELRDKIFANIREEIARYYNRVIKGDYSFDGMPEINKGIRGWIEDKIWGLLVLIGEPEQTDNPYIWKKVGGDFWKAEE